MKYIDEFRNVDITQKLIEKINEKFQGENNKKVINIMEVCGTHTMSIYKNGIDKLLPKNINLLSGPGCPVCVTDISYIDTAIDLSKNKNNIICTFSDMIRVPGSKSTLEKERSKGGNIINIYSPLDCIDIANKNKDKEVIFLGIGFETTIPVVGLTIKKAFNYEISNFSVYSSFKTMPKVMEKIILDENININGFICPGHVGSIIGNQPFHKLAKDYNLPMVMSGFEHMDIVYAIYRLCEMIENKEFKCENEYKRIVKEEGNKKTLNLMKEVFEISSSNWRGLGTIENTGLKINSKYINFDTKHKFNLKEKKTQISSQCLCAEILKGIKKPKDCKLFKTKCSPKNPMGACMVSREGTCANFYKYE